MVGPLYVPVGTAAATQTLEAYNIGDGTLSLSVWVPAGVTWVSAAVGAGVCTQNLYPSPCIPIQFNLSTASLSQGTYTASVTVFDPHAADSPQTVIVTAEVGDAQPTSINAWMAPGTAAGWGWSVPTVTPIPRASCPGGTASTQDGGTWLSLQISLQGTMGGALNCWVQIQLAPPAQMPDGTYAGSATFPVTMRVVSPPYAVPSTTQIGLRLAQGSPTMAYPFLPAISLGNEGSTLVAQAVSASGAGVSASVSGGVVLAAVDPGTLAPGAYPNAGLLTIQCNAINCPLQIPVSLQIVPRGPPLIATVVDNATFTTGATVAQGDVMVVKGEQLSFSAPAFPSAATLPASLGGAAVLVNGTPVPLYYSSYGQIAFQMPANTPIGAAGVQVERDGLTSGTVPVNVARRAPGILVITDTAYHLLDLGHPAKAGATVIVWAIGLGATIPAVADGLPAPADPLAAVSPAPAVQIGGSNVAPLYALLSPGSVGLYQVAVTLPAGVVGISSVRLAFPEISSNAAGLVIQ